MRRDNVPDYPWLCFALLALITAYDRLHAAGKQGPERQKIVEGLLNGLSPDPRAFVSKPPTSLSGLDAELRELRELFRKHEKNLLAEFESLRPSEDDYSPLSFFFNFPHNLLKAMTVDALLRSERCGLSLNDLLTGVPSNGGKKTLVATLMDYARKSPDPIRGRLVPAIVYDPRSGRRVFADTLRRLS